jgi:ABC-type nitrate/sulfonate/bicarbonate transport system permease component
MTLFWIGFFLGMFLGVMLGILIISLCRVSSDAEKKYPPDMWG